MEIQINEEEIEILEDEEKKILETLLYLESRLNNALREIIKKAR